MQDNIKKLSGYQYGNAEIKMKKPTYTIKQGEEFSLSVIGRVRFDGIIEAAEKDPEYLIVTSIATGEARSFYIPSIEAEQRGYQFTRAVDGGADEEAQLKPAEPMENCRCVMVESDEGETMAVSVDINKDKDLLDFEEEYGNAIALNAASKKYSKTPEELIIMHEAMVLDSAELASGIYFVEDQLKELVASCQGDEISEPPDGAAKFENLIDMKVKCGNLIHIDRAARKYEKTAEAMRNLHEIGVFDSAEFSSGIYFPVEMTDYYFNDIKQRQALVEKIENKEIDIDPILDDFGVITDCYLASLDERSKQEDCLAELRADSKAIQEECASWFGKYTAMESTAAKQKEQAVKDSEAIAALDRVVDRLNKAARDIEAESKHWEGKWKISEDQLRAKDVTIGGLQDDIADCQAAIEEWADIDRNNNTVIIKLQNELKSSGVEDIKLECKNWHDKYNAINDIARGQNSTIEGLQDNIESYQGALKKSEKIACENKEIGLNLKAEVEKWKAYSSDMGDARDQVTARCYKNEDDLRHRLKAAIGVAKDEEGSHKRFRAMSEDLEKVNSELHRKIAGLEERIEVGGENAADVIADLEDVNSQLYARVSEFQRVERVNKGLENGALRQDIIDMESQREAMRIQLVELKAEVKALNDRDAWRQSAEANCTTIDHFKKESEKWETVARGDRLAYIELKKNYDESTTSFQSKIDALLSERNELSQELEESKGKIHFGVTDLNTKLLHMKNEWADTEKKLQKKEIECDAAKKNFEELSDKHAQYREASLNRLKNDQTKIEDINADLKKSQLEVCKHANEAAAAKKELFDFKQTNENLQSFNRRGRDARNDLRKELETLKKSLMLAKEECRSVIKDRQELEKTYDAYRAGFLQMIEAIKGKDGNDESVVILLHRISQLEKGVGVSHEDKEKIIASWYDGYNNHQREDLLMETDAVLNASVREMVLAAARSKGYTRGKENCVMSAYIVPDSMIPGLEEGEKMQDFKNAIRKAHQEGFAKGKTEAK